jgi:NADPH:quinone reductase-like Zn-dependent oxidoreductase
MIATDAWVLYPGSRPGANPPSARANLSREDFSFEEPAEDEALVEPLFVSWEANVDHALSRQPIDVCHQRNEASVVLGNLGVVRVLRGAQVTGSPAEGDICIVMPFEKRDTYGYAELIYAYDAPGTIGLLAKRTKVRADMLLPIPGDTKGSIPQWAAYARYFTAWDNWRVAHGCWAVQVAGHDPAENLVYGWGGGVAFAELQLARRAGFRVAMSASTDERLAGLAEHGITPVDRRLFPDLHLGVDGVRDDPERSLRYRASEREFIRVIHELSDGAGAAIFIDNIGAPLYRATLKGLAREGVLATVGWKHGMRTSVLRASECIKRHLHINTHVWRYGDCAAIRDYQESTGWFPVIDPEAIYDFDAVPQLADDYLAGRITTYFPLLRVNHL